jgi:hypothetical protein
MNAITTICSQFARSSSRIACLAPALGAALLGLAGPAHAQALILPAQTPPPPITAPVAVPVSVANTSASLGPASAPASTTLAPLVSRWGLMPVPCTDQAARIQMGGEAICVAASAALPGGSYTYDPVANRLNFVQQNTASTPRFVFSNALAYSNCVDDILQLYLEPKAPLMTERQGSCAAEIVSLYGHGGLTWTQTLELLKAADIQVSATGNLFPQWGQRERIARMFGFVYRMDVDNPAIRKIAALVSRP